MQPLWLSLSFCSLYLQALSLECLQNTLLLWRDVMSYLCLCKTDKPGCSQKKEGIKKGYGWTSCTAYSLPSFTYRTLSTCPVARQVVCMCCHLTSGKCAFLGFCLTIQLASALTVDASSCSATKPLQLEASSSSSQNAPSSMTFTNLSTKFRPHWVVLPAASVHLLQKFVRPLTKPNLSI